MLEVSNKFGDEGASALANAFTVNKTLKWLILDHSNIAMGVLLHFPIPSRKAAPSCVWAVTTLGKMVRLQSAAPSMSNSVPACVKNIDPRKKGMHSKKTENSTFD